MFKVLFCIKQQFSYQNNTVSSAPSSTYEHYLTSLGRFDNRPIAVGGYSPFLNKKVEELRKGVWRTLNDLPFVEKQIYSYSMVTFNEMLYLFGRFFNFTKHVKRIILLNYIFQYTGALTLAIKYDGTTWTQVGSLMNQRYAHRSIVIDNSIMHIGGWNTQ